MFRDRAEFFARVRENDSGTSESEPGSLEAMLCVHDFAIARLDIGSVECEDATSAHSRRAGSPREPVDKPAVEMVSNLPARGALY